MVDCGGLRLRCAGGDYASSGETAVSVRLHEIRLEPGNGATESEANLAAGTVARQIYLGAQRDYLVNLPGGQQLRVVTPAAIEVPVGSPVRLHLPPERCRALAH
jgi:iron(III) transport system ATP-binding protein